MSHAESPLREVGARRLRQGAGAGIGAALLAVVIAASVLVATRGSAASGRHTGSPTPAQIAHGTWHTVPEPSEPLCQTGSAAISIGRSALAINTWGKGKCKAATEVFSPVTGAWQVLPPPPAALRGYPSVARSGSTLAVVAGDRAALLNLASRTWQLLPPAPASLVDKTVVPDGHAFLFFGGYESPGQVPEYDGGRWRLLPALPHGHAQLVDVSGYAQARHVWAFASTEVQHVHRSHDPHHPDAIESTTSVRPRVLTLGSSGWSMRHRSSQMPLTVTKMDHLDGAVLAAGTNCASGFGCPASGIQLATVRPGTFLGHSLPSPSYMGSRVSYFLSDAVSTGRVVIGINGSADHGHHRDVHPGTALVFDPAQHHWLTTPPSPEVRFSYGNVWTSAGLVELGSPPSRCGCRRGGAWLEPAH